MSEQLAEPISYPDDSRVTSDNWRSYAECSVETEQYFYAPSHFERKPEKDRREGVARAICRRCPAVELCLDFALKNDEPRGIWGGLNELERKRILHGRLRANLHSAASE